MRKREFFEFCNNLLSLLTSIPKGIGFSGALLKRNQVVRRKFAYFVIEKSDISPQTYFIRNNKK